MENTSVKEVVKNEDVAPVIKEAAKNPAATGGIIALGAAVVVGLGYLVWKGVEKAKAEKEALDKEHEFFVPNP